MSELTCFVCKREFLPEQREPHVLPTCGHTVCSTCIREWLAASPCKVTCPEDQKEFNLDPVEGLAAFPKNISLGRMLAEKKPEEKEKEKEREREKPKEKEAEKPKEKEVEKEKEKEKQEVSLASEESVSSFNDSQPNFCKSHRKSTDLVCLTDNRVICADCVLFGEHKNHEYKRDSEFLREAKGKIENLQAELGAARQSLFWNQGPKKLSELREKLKNKQDELNSRISEHFDHLYSKLKELEKSMQDELTFKIKDLGTKVNTFETQMNKITEKESSITSKLSSLSEKVNSRVPDYEKLIEAFAGSSDPLLAITEMHTQLRMLEKEYSDLQLSQSNTISLSTNLSNALTSLEKNSGIELKVASLSPPASRRISYNTQKTITQIPKNASPIPKLEEDDEFADFGKKDDHEELLNEKELEELATKGSAEVSGKSKPLIRNGVRPENLYSGDVRQTPMYVTQKVQDSIYSKPLIGKKDFLNESIEDQRRSMNQRANMSMGQVFGGMSQTSFGPLPPPRPPVPKLSAIAASGKMLMTNPDPNAQILKGLKADETGIPKKKEDELMNYSDFHMNDNKILAVLNDVVKNKKVKKLILDNNKITDAGFANLLKKLYLHESLEKISLSGNLLEESVFVALEDYAPQIKTIRTFIFTNNPKMKQTAKVKKAMTSLKKAGFTIEI